MRQIRTQSGFTLVELIVVLAIASLLMAGIIAGQSNVRQQASKMAAVDQIKNKLEKVRNEANTTVADGKGTSGQVVFGKLVEFNPTQPAIMTISTLIAEDDNFTGKLSRCDTRTSTYPNGMQYTSVEGLAVKGAIIFVRKSETGPDQVYTAPPNYTDIPAGSVASCSALPAYSGGLVFGTTPAGPPPCLSPNVINPVTGICGPPAPPPCLSPNVINPVTGICGPPPPPPPVAVTISPTSHGFPAWHMFAAGGAKQSKTFTVQNPSATTAINVTSTPISGATSSFSITFNTCSYKSLAPGASCSVVVQFFPPSGPSNNRLANAGLKNATLTVNNSDGVAATSAALSGWAVTDRMGPGDQQFMNPDNNVNVSKSLRGYNTSCHNNAHSCPSALVLFDSGNLVLYPNATNPAAPGFGVASWMTGPGPGTYTEMQAGNGVFGLYTSQGAGVWGTNWSYSGVWLQIFDGGALWRMKPDWNAPSGGYEPIWP